MSENFQLRKAAVLGAGVMGAQIAAHLVNANVPAILFDLPAKEGRGDAVRPEQSSKKMAFRKAPTGSIFKNFRCPT